MFVDPEENLFGWVGLKDNGDHYVAAVGLYEYFWTLDEGTRKKILDGWTQAIEAYRSPDFFENSKHVDGYILVSECDEVVEEKPDADIIPFPVK
jgi:hypothetical protein